MICPNCHAASDLKDNFCPNCGTALRERRLPVLPQPRLPAHEYEAQRWVLQQALVLTAGAVLPMLARGLLRLALRSAPIPRLPVLARRNGAERLQPDEYTPLIIETHAVTETRIVRRVRIRR